MNVKQDRDLLNGASVSCMFNHRVGIFEDRNKYEDFTVSYVTTFKPHFMKTGSKFITLALTHRNHIHKHTRGTNDAA
jgi:hypothetical protein